MENPMLSAPSFCVLPDFLSRIFRSYPHFLMSHIKTWTRLYNLPNPVYSRAHYAMQAEKAKSLENVVCRK